MKQKLFALLAIIIASFAATATASAQGWNPFGSSHSTSSTSYSTSSSASSSHRAARRDHAERPQRVSHRSERSSSSGVGARPGAWCGWYMRTRHGGGPEYNLAANWRNYGRAGSAQVGAIVVWPHHVGEIVGRASNGMWLVHSGNDGGAVRTRARSISGATIRI